MKKKTPSSKIEGHKNSRPRPRFKHLHVRNIFNVKILKILSWYSMFENLTQH